ncbi:hypothetical protein K2Q00_00080 [Patescibacteria group bacterium]|nr:hypothetical protein [Patescibacteria group bacterium]
MEWIVMVATILVVLLLFLGLFFISSRAVTIVEETREEIEKESPEELKKEVSEAEEEVIKAVKAEEDQFYSHG